MNVQDLYLASGLEPTEIISGGAEWHGPCPACGGTKRFIIWRQRNRDGGEYWCRDCDKWGDNVQFQVEFMGVEYRAAFEVAGRQKDAFNSPSSRPAQARQYSGREITPPTSTWREKALAFVDYAHEQILTNPQALAYLASRGIDKDSVVKHRLGYNPGKAGKYHVRPRSSWALPPKKDQSGKDKEWLWFPAGIVIPDQRGPEVWSIQIRQPDGYKFGPRYVFLEGGSNASYVLGHDRQAFVVVEARLCAIAVYQAAGDLVGVFAAQTVGGHPDTATHKLLAKAVQILDALDYEEITDQAITDGQMAGLRAVARWKKLYPHCDRWPVPAAKDPGDAVKKGVDLREWVKAGLAPVVLVRHKFATQTKETAAPAPAPVPPVAARVSYTPPSVAIMATVEPPQTPLPSQAAVTQTAPGQLPQDVAELLALLQAHPVRIYNDKTTLQVVETKPGWRRNHWAVSCRLSALVFQSQAVGLYLARHPEKWIHGSNLVRIAA